MLTYLIALKLHRERKTSVGMVDYARSTTPNPPQPGLARI